MHYIDIDVSTKKSAPCIVDGKDKIVRETKLPSTYGSRPSGPAQGLD